MNKSQCTVSQQRLVEMMQKINFGTIESVTVASGEPLLDPPPKVTREVKFGAENGTRPEASFADFVLKAQVLELFDSITELQGGVIERIEVRHGLPFRMIVREPCTR